MSELETYLEHRARVEGERADRAIARAEKAEQENTTLRGEVSRLREALRTLLFVVDESPGANATADAVISARRLLTPPAASDGPSPDHVCESHCAHCAAYIVGTPQPDPYTLDRLKADGPARTQEPMFVCNKCGYVGSVAHHRLETGCNYEAAPAPPASQEEPRKTGLNPCSLDNCPECDGNQ